jgi:hypothetical protein
LARPTPSTNPDLYRPAPGGTNGGRDEPDGPEPSQRPRKRFFEATVLAVAGLVFLVSVLPNLANHPAITDDEVWVMSAADKIARNGVFGSDMFRGFFGADHTYFFNLPAHHFAVAAAFKVLGAGVLQARLVGVAYGLVTIVVTYFLARRLYGVGAAVLALVLLLFLRLNMGFDTGLPLQELAASLRYDLAPVPFILGGFFVLLGGDSWRRAGLAGALFGLATLLQFYGVFALTAAGAFFLLQPTRGGTALGGETEANAATGFGQRFERRLSPGLKLVAALWGAALLVCLPYGVFVLAHLHDFRGQAGTVGNRDDFASPGFYMRNVIHEVDRFVRPLGFKEVPRGADARLVEPRYLGLGEALRRRPSAKLAILIGLPAALVFTGWRAFRGKRRSDRLLFCFLAGLPLQYALFDQLKLYIYWIPVVPFLCIALAPLLIRLVRPPPGDRVRLALAAGTALCLFLVLAEGSAARINGIRSAGRESDYTSIGRTLHATVPPGSRVVGSTGLWWALRDTDYRSYFLFFYLTSPEAGEYRTTISAFLQGLQPDYLVLTRLGVEELQKHLVPADRADYESYLDKNAALVERLDGPEIHSYGYIEVWRFRATPQ